MSTASRGNEREAVSFESWCVCPDELGLAAGEDIRTHVMQTGPDQSPACAYPAGLLAHGLTFTHGDTDHLRSDGAPVSFLLS